MRHGGLSGDGGKLSRIGEPLQPLAVMASANGFSAAGASGAQTFHHRRRYHIETRPGVARCQREVLGAGQGLVRRFHLGLLESLPPEA